MLIDLDHIDHALIELLSKDGRLSNSELARTLHMAEATVRRRVRRLLDNDVLKIVAVRNPDQLGHFLSAIIGCSVDRARAHQIVQSLARRPETRYVGYSTGARDIMIEAFFRSNDHLLEFLTELGDVEGVKAIETSVILRVAKFAYEWETSSLEEPNQRG